MKLGMLSLSGINMPWYKFCPMWGRFGYMLLTNRSFSQEDLWFPRGDVSPLCSKRYPLPLITFNFFSHVNVEQRECCVNFCDFWGSFGHFYALTLFTMHLCAQFKFRTTCTCSSAYKLVEKSNLGPWVHA